MRRLTLKPGEERRLRRGHLWIFDNEVKGLPGDLEPGEAVTVVDSNGKLLGSGTVNPRSRIVCRLYSRRGDQALDVAYFKRRFRSCQTLRERLGFTDVYRLVHAEADGLPGLVIDRFGSFFTVQHNAAGMDRRKELVLQALDEVFQPRTVLSMDDNPSRALEGLPSEVAWAGEEPPEIAWYEQDGLQWPIDLSEGQKTGAYLDQVFNRREMARYCRGARVLDAFSYTGGFGALAAKYGAKEVVLADRSERALELAKEMFARNGLPEPRFEQADLLHNAPKAKALGGPFDMVVSDPPPLIPNKGSKRDGLKKYLGVFTDAMRWTGPEGLTAVFSCSHHAGRDDILEQVKRAGRRAQKRLRRLAIYGASPDHPVAVGHPETEYLHGILVEVG
ncbi:methyltransferase domain-containing protein [bacterium]|nr:methyltransferase domain-containing protein [bacterium]